jgi:ribosomal protein L7/L12
MSMTKEQILEAAKELDVDQRMELVDDLLIMDGSGDREEISKEWADEIKRRMDEIDRGEDVTVDADEAFDQLQAKYAK